MSQQNSFEKIYEVVRRIPKGRVATYGQIAALAGNRRWSRVVGFALHVNPDPDGIPCFRVVNRLGEVSSAFAFGGENRQIALLEADGVPCPRGRVDLKTYQWKPDASDASVSTAYDLETALEGGARAFLHGSSRKGPDPFDKAYE